MSVIFDFDSMAAGTTTVAAIKSSFPGSMLDDLVFSSVGGAGEYDFSTGGGRALALKTGGTGLELADPTGDAFGNPGELTISLTDDSMEIGFEIGDWRGPFNVNLYDGANAVGSFQVSTASNRTHFIQNGTPFNRIVLTANPDWPAANWVVPALYIQEAAAPLQVPTVNEWGMRLFH